MLLCQSCLFHITCSEGHSLLSSWFWPASHAKFDMAILEYKFMEVHYKSRLEAVTTHHQTLACKSQVDIQPPLRVINKRRAVPRTQSHGQMSLAQSELLHLICGVPPSSLAKLKIIPTRTHSSCKNISYFIFLFVLPNDNIHYAKLSFHRAI